MRPASPALVLHGGAGPRPSAPRARQLRQALQRVARDVYARLRHASALEAVVEAVRQLEDDPLFNAGTGSVLQADGVVRMSAAVMDGAPRRFAAVLNIERVRNPVLVARALLDRADRVLAGAGAQAFARARGFGPWDPVTPARRRQWERRRREAARGTVGAVALDTQGRLAAATSTGGKGWETPGRVSDSGQPAGNYATAQAAVSCTGLGEDILDEALAARLAQQVAAGQPLPAAARQVGRECRQRGRHLAFIALDAQGRLAWVRTTPALFAVACTGRGLRESF